MLIILYGDMSNKPNAKHQRLIEGKATCGYREYARNYGHIIYLTPQKTKLPWEHSMTADEAVSFIKQYPNAIVWALKHSPARDTKILSKISNKKVYYSCNSKNMYNAFCDFSLVDTSARVQRNAKLWFKGKDPNYWLPRDNKKEFDYLLIGRRGDKNELHFLTQLRLQVKDKRRVLWIGGASFEYKINKLIHHDVVCTEFIPQKEVRRLIPTAKVGVLFTELAIEGFPQSYLEMTMCGLPVVYNKRAPLNTYYQHPATCLLTSKENLITSAENLLHVYDSAKCREVAIENYSLDLSYRRIKECFEL